MIAITKRCLKELLKKIIKGPYRVKVVWNLANSLKNFFYAKKSSAFSLLEGSYLMYV